MSPAAHARGAPPPAGGEAAARERFRGRRRRAFAGGAVSVVTLIAAGAFLAAPGDLAAVRLLGVALGWWAAVGAQLVVAATLVFDRQDGARPGSTRG